MNEISNIAPGTVLLFVITKVKVRVAEIDKGPNRQTTYVCEIVHLDKNMNHNPSLKNALAIGDRREWNDFMMADFLKNGLAQIVEEE